MAPRWIKGPSGLYCGGLIELEATRKRGDKEKKKEEGDTHTHTARATTANPRKRPEPTERVTPMALQKNVRYVSRLDGRAPFRKEITSATPLPHSEGGVCVCVCVCVCEREREREISFEAILSSQMLLTHPPAAMGSQRAMRTALTMSASMMPKRLSQPMK